MIVKPMRQQWTISQLPPAMSHNVYDLFHGKYFVVPDYQRNYAWEKKHWRDLWNDIKDGLSTSTPHYWGQITLRDAREEKYCGDALLHKYEIVDGQQRIATLHLFMLAFFKSGKSAIKENFIKCGDTYKLELGSLNKQFLKDLVDRRNPQPNIKTNRLLKEALEYFEGQIRALGHLDDLFRYLQHTTFLTEFALPDEALAIRTFQSLNDRGRPLTLLDKTKSFLMFYSMRYLEKEKLGDCINKSFGNVFTNFDIIKEIGDSENISYIKYTLSEGELLRFFYHYFACYSLDKYSIQNHWYDLDIGAEDVFEEFLKSACIQLKDDQTKLGEFIKEFMENFDSFVSAFGRVADKIQKENPYRKLFTFLDGGPNARVYPLIIALETRGLLDDFLDIVETLDLRIYKIRGTDPRADLYRKTISEIKKGLSPEDIKANLLSFIDDFMWDSYFRTHLTNLLYPHLGIKYILWEFEKYKNPSFDDCNYDLYKTVQIEHIFSQRVRPTFPSYGFQNEEEYMASLHKIGNLCLLEEKINKSKKVGNKEPPAKADDYQQSHVPGAKDLGYYISTQGFAKNDVEKRTQEIVEFCLQRWKVT